MKKGIAITSAILLSALMLYPKSCCEKAPTKNTSTKSGAEMARKAQYPVDDIFLHRWSPRAMSGQEISDAELMSLFEAARWAPSSYNEQPWRFVYAKRNDKNWDTFLNLLVPFNQEWAKNAGVLVVMVSKKNFSHNGEYSSTHSFDTGAAWENLALQASLNGIVVHGMSGFDFERAKKELGVSDEYQVEAMFALGKPGDIKNLPDYLQSKERPSDRKPVAEFVFEGAFNR